MAHLAKREVITESPCEYADQIGREYCKSKSIAHKKEFGQYLTPLSATQFMAGLYQAPDKDTIRVLDPGAGTGVLSCALLERLAFKVSRVILTVYELDRELIPLLKQSLQYSKRWLKKRGTDLEYNIIEADFVLENGAVLGETEQSIFGEAASAKYDVVICNPPYFKLNKQDPRAKAGAYIVHGQPNIYAIFMAISAYLLETNGELIFITPRSFTAGPYFKLFRKRFFSIMRPEYIHIFGSRRDAFNKDEVLQENVIIRAKRDDEWYLNNTVYCTTVSYSNGLDDISQAHKRREPVTSIIDMKSENKFVFIPGKKEDRTVVRLIQSWKGSFHLYGIEISTGPVVPFRAARFLCDEKAVPLLWMQNVSSMNVRFPARMKKKQYILESSENSGLLLPNKNYVLLRRFSAKEEKRRLVAAPYIAEKFQAYDVIGIENHLNYIYRPKGELTVEETYGVAAILNSLHFDTYFRTYNGNTQVSATELRFTPLPSLEVIGKIGHRASTKQLNTEELEDYVNRTLENQWVK